MKRWVSLFFIKLTIGMVLSGESTQKLGLLSPFEDVFIQIIIVIFIVAFEVVPDMLINANETNVIHQSFLSFGLFVPHGHVWRQAKMKLGPHSFVSKSRR